MDRALHPDADRQAAERLDALAIREAALTGVLAKGAIWTDPRLRAQIAYRGWTRGGELRQASFKGLRQE
jgi:bifunctional non-homologous end joining protein LigD